MRDFKSFQDVTRVLAILSCVILISYFIGYDSGYTVRGAMSGGAITIMGENGTPQGSLADNFIFILVFITGAFLIRAKTKGVIAAISTFVVSLLSLIFLYRVYLQLVVVFVDSDWISRSSAIVAASVGILLLFTVGLDLLAVLFSKRKLPQVFED